MARDPKVQHTGASFRSTDPRQTDVESYIRDRDPAAARAAAAALAVPETPAAPPEAPPARQDALGRARELVDDLRRGAARVGRDPRAERALDAVLDAVAALEARVAAVERSRRGGSR
jgi:hypothetical protein